MLFLSLNVLASFKFVIILYLFFLYSLILYILPISKNISNFFNFKSTNSTFEYVTGFDLLFVALTPFLILFFFIFSWTMPITSIWFGNLIISIFQIKISYLLINFTFLLIMGLFAFIYFNSREIYDFVLVLLNFIFWIFFLFFANNLFSIIFIIEITSTLLFLLFVTSCFSSTYFYNNLNINLYNYFNNSSPLFFIQAVIFFFWTSLLASLNLFLSIIFFYLKFFSFEWTMVENIFFFIVNTINIKDAIFLSLVWYNFLFCFFLKCGIVPFYFWKPSFFKGLSLHFLYIYITFFYYFLLILILTILLINFNEIFYYFVTINSLIALGGFFLLFFVLSEAFYIKTFLAISSTLNTLFIFLTLNSVNLIDFFFFI